MSSIFSKIIAGEIPCYKVAENDQFIAFLDISPVAKGHTLVIPKTEIDYIFDIENSLYSELFLFAKQVAIALKKAVPCTKVGVSVIGLDVPHSHIHLVPISQIQDINFEQERLHFSIEEFNQLSNHISSIYKNLF
ncbi:MAG: HIT domain-containing protein [Bacteroidales bacterium]|jgi:histidine triad (HIT) family protein|nr:HIT domain-containing protein [Bacteroidales bacterium]